MVKLLLLLLAAMLLQVAPPLQLVVVDEPAHASKNYGRRIYLGVWSAGDQVLKGTQEVSETALDLSQMSLAPAMGILSSFCC
jgi:hypothetical protein